MIIGSGIDLVEIGRIQHSVDRYGKRFLDRVYTSAEQAYCLRKRKAAESFAARFAAKEAGAKALGTRASGETTYDLGLPIWPFYALAWAGLAVSVLLVILRLVNQLTRPVCAAAAATPFSH